MSKLPDDLIVEILSRLPVKPLLQFKCVCRSWRSIISSPRFAKLQLNRARNSTISTAKFHLVGEDIELEMKINMYPTCPQPHLALGVEPHTDMSALTILVANSLPGLQIWKYDNWIAVNYLPNALFIHAGDQLEVPSNGKYKSVLHRSLVNKESIRMSWAVFVSPPSEALIGPLAELVDDQNPTKHSTKTFAEFCSTRRFNTFH